MKIIKIGIICLLLSGCSVKFDSFDPATSTLKWIITNEME